MFAKEQTIKTENVFNLGRNSIFPSNFKSLIYYNFIIFLHFSVFDSVRVKFGQILQMQIFHNAIKIK
jgi:hypothetical protein